jgi:hypothetical protein
MSHPNESIPARRLHRFWILAGILCAWSGPAAKAQNPEIADLQNGYVSWSNANTNLYYTLEHSSALTNGSPWDGACREWQDLRSTSGVFTVPIGRFYRVVASSNPLHTASLSPATTAVNAGYYEATNLAAVDADLVSANVRSGVSIFGVTGTPAVVNTASGNATTNDLLAGRVAWVNGAAITGAIPTRLLASTTVVVNAGYYAATNLAAVDADLATGNLRAGTTLFGVTGSPMIVNTASGNATSNDLLAGYVAWVDGGAVTGAIPTRTLADTTTVMNAGYYAADSLNAVEVDLAADNILSDANIFGITGLPYNVNTGTGNATTNQILAGRVAWVDGLAVTGAIPTRTLADTTTVVSAGYYAATNLAAADPDLVATNVRAGVSLFGVDGTIPPAPVPKTGCITSRETGDDGNYQKGVAWPVPRFTAGTSISSNCVTDNLTGLMWLRNPTGTLRNCSDAITYCEGLTGSGGRGGYTDWRLPNVREMQSLFDYDNRAPALPMEHPFIGVPATNDFWTGTMAYNGGGSVLFFATSMDRGTTQVLAPSNTLCAWPVRGGF